MAKPEVNIPIIGMSDQHPMNLKENQYPLMLNGNILTDINSAITLTNEHSNLLCNNFPEGVKVIGTLFVPEDNIEFVWLTDPTDPSKDQIGYLSEYDFTDFNDAPAENPCVDCGGFNKEDAPLETKTQTPLCNYTVVAKGSCFSFNIDHPIRTGVFKKDNCGSSIYFTDGINPLRFLKMNEDHTLSNDQLLITGYVGDCNGTPDTPTDSNCFSLADPDLQCSCCQPVYSTDPTEIDCEKARLFPVVGHICIEPKEITPGGSLRAGTYQLAACYAGVNGERATRTFSASNPVSIFDPSQTLTDELSYVTDLAIKFLIKDLEPTKYSFIDVFVIANLNNVTSIKQFPTIDITKLKNDTLEYVVSNFEKGIDKSIDDIFQVFPVYETADVVTTAGDTLLWANLRGPRDLNLQRAVNGISSTLRWVTSEANEDFYANGIYTANYRGYLRDEVYALGIVLERNNTLDTCAYPFIGRQINTAFTPIETEDCPDPLGAFPGKPLYSFTGEWIPTRNYFTRAPLSLVPVPYDIVRYLGVYYQALIDNINIDPVTGLGTSWGVFEEEGPCALCVRDTSAVSGLDVLQYPGCENVPPSGEGGGGDLRDYNLRWQVYNTACNSGELCFPERSSLRCVTHSEEVICHSYRFQFTTWDVAVTYTNGEVVVYNSVTYKSLIDGNLGLTPDSNPSAWLLQETDVCVPEDCYIDEDNDCLPCEDNYPTPIEDVRHSTDWDSGDSYVINDIVIYLGKNYKALVDNTNVTPTAANATTWFLLGDACEDWPETTSNPCNEDHVRTRQDALDYYTANGTYLLCVDATLASLPNILSDPYVVKTSSELRKILDASTKQWCQYDILDIKSKVIDSVDPTPKWTEGSQGLLDPICLTGFKFPDKTLIQQWLLPNVNMPNTSPENYDPSNSIGSFNPSPEGKCNDYGPTAPLMYMLGHELLAPVPPSPCCTAAGEDCDPANWGWGATADYWSIGPQVQPPGGGLGEQNNNVYQSYWYSFTATTLQPTIIIKSKIFYKYGDLGIAGMEMEDGDIRIDVYEGSPLLANPTYSTGLDTVNPATYYYDGTVTPNDIDTGVLVIGDVGNSTGDLTAAGQLPLIPGTIYYVHVYLLQQAIDKLNVSPLGNPNKSDACESPSSDEGSCCPCYFANYAWVNMCMNSQSCDEADKVTVSLPETWELQCTYQMNYQQNEVVDTGCIVQTYEYGDFAFWESETKTYPNNREVWGDMCGKPIRHFKMPDCLVTPHQDQDLQIPTLNDQAVDYGPFNPARKSKIYPLGIRVDAEDVKAWLKWAVLEGLITEAERLSITGYKIVRGNRATNKSIVGKGLLFDMWKYQEYDYVNDSYSSINTFYPSYPFNDLRDDQYLQRGGNLFKHPFQGQENDRFAFLSPETTFNSPTIGVELKFEATVFGSSLGNFYTVKNHPKYILLSNGGIGLAAGLAAINLSGDLLEALGTLLGQFDVGFSNTIPVGSIVGFVGEFLELAPKFFIYAKQWRDIILDFGVPKNFARYYAAVGNYHSSGVIGAVQNNGNKRRLIDNSTYLLAGNITVSDEGVLSKINNYQREDSVYLHLSDTVNFALTSLVNTFTRDTSRFILSNDQDNQACRFTDRKSNVASYYASIKHFLPDQYGEIHDIEWLFTGECVKIDWDAEQSSTGCAPIYGGDTFIGPMTQRRKLPFFLDNPVGVSTGVDFQYQHISNITDAVYYFNSIGESPSNSSGVQFTEVEHKFDCIPVNSKGDPKTPLYLDGSIYLFSYGIVKFIGESSFNLNFRYAKDTKFADFYPHQSDIENSTQEYRVPIETPNKYLYNRSYSKQNTENFFCTQPVIYSNADCITDYQNRVINSLPDTDSDFYTDNWRLYLAADYKDYPLTNGDLVDITGIEKNKVLMRFDKTFLVLNAYYTMTTDTGVAQIGTSSLFSQTPLEYAKSQLGYAGTQHRDLVSNQYGHFWVDAKRSAVIMLANGEGGPEEISQPFNTFFNNNLPFYILRAFPNARVDNSYKDLGITMCWDNKFDRLFLTKLDYELLSPWKRSNSPNDYVDYIQGDDGYYGFYRCTVVDEQTNCVPISLTDTTYFCNKSWTLAYSPVTKSWISYYSFTPNYYVAHENYFQSGINYPQDGDLSKIGIWNHLITNKSFQVFYGTLYPFITDVVVKDQLVNKQLHSIEYQADFLRFQNDYDYFYNPAVTFNKMVIWSENKNTGNLELVPQAQNQMGQGLLYPRSNADSTSVLVTRKENSWRVNQFFDLVVNKFSNVPPMLYNCHPYLKTVNPDAINYYKPTFQKSHLTSDYFTLRFINDDKSNYKIINKWFINKSIQSFT